MLRSPTDGFAVPISINLYTWRESAEMISTGSCCAMSSEIGVLPEAVGPTRTRILLPGCEVKELPISHIVHPISFLLPTFFADERDKLKTDDFFRLKCILDPPNNMKILNVEITDRNNKRASILELVKQWPGNSWRARRYQNTLEGSKFLPSDCSVSTCRCDLILKFVESLPCLRKQIHMTLNREHASAHFREYCRLIT